jgi:hypothetical protein
VAGVEEGAGAVMRWQERLVKVRSESELRAGMTVVRVNCANCSRTHVYTLVRPEPRILGWCRDFHPEMDTCACPGWTTVPRSHADKWTPGHSIRRGQLYRLRDLDDSKEQTRERERERVE